MFKSCFGCFRDALNCFLFSLRKKYRFNKDILSDPSVASSHYYKNTYFVWICSFFIGAKVHLIQQASFNRYHECLGCNSSNVPNPVSHIVSSFSPWLETFLCSVISYKAKSMYSLTMTSFQTVLEHGFEDLRPLDDSGFTDQQVITELCRSCTLRSFRVSDQTKQSRHSGQDQDINLLRNVRCPDRA